MSKLKVLIVDDEPLARARLRTLLADCSTPSVVAAEAKNAAEALAQLSAAVDEPYDAVLLDIHMPGCDGMALAHKIKALPQSPAIVFITAHAEHAVEAFDVSAIDYLTKPVRLERLQKSLQKVEQTIKQIRRQEPENKEEVLIIQERGATLRLPVQEVLYFKAELKYISVRTALKTHILEGSLNELEARYGDRFLRIHRNALVRVQAIRAIEKHDDVEEGEGWAVRLVGIDDLLLVSRRQLAAVKAVISG